MPLDIHGSGEKTVQISSRKIEKNDFFAISDPKYKFSQIILSDAIQSEMKSIIGFYENRKKVFENNKYRYLR